MHRWCLCLKDVDQRWSKQVVYACLAYKKNIWNIYEIWNNMNIPIIPSQAPFLSTYLHTPSISNHRSPRMFLDVWEVIELANGGQWIAQGIHVGSRAVHRRLGESINWPKTITAWPFPGVSGAVLTQWIYQNRLLPKWWSTHIISYPIFSLVLYVLLWFL